MANRSLESGRIIAAGLWLGLSFVVADSAQAQPTRRDAELNGPRLNGAELLGPDGKTRLSLLYARLPAGASLDGTRLLAATGGKPMAAGALLEGEATGNVAVQLRIDRIAPAPDPKPATPENENADVSTYAVSYQLGSYSGDGATRSFKSTSEWAPLCAGGELAIPIIGRWNYHRGVRGDSGRVNSDSKLLTFACRGSALTKCIEKFGYKPWQPPRRSDGGAEISMDVLHQACVRAVRADYCGNGESMTREGEVVNFYDAAGVVKDNESWAFEAAWTAAGATCINRTRLPKNPDDAKQSVSGYIAKSCRASWSAKPCPGSKQASGALIFTETDLKAAAAPPPK